MLFLFRLSISSAAGGIAAGGGGAGGAGAAASIQSTVPISLKSLQSPVLHYYHFDVSERRRSRDDVLAKLNRHLSRRYASMRGNLLCNIHIEHHKNILRSGKQSSYGVSDEGPTGAEMGSERLVNASF